MSAVLLALDVRMDRFDIPAGTLVSYDDGSIDFAYSPDYLTGGQPISLAMPLSDEPVGDVRARAFFDNLLPESDRIQTIIDHYALSRANIVEILSHIGADCPGAISCLPIGDPPIKVPGNLETDYRPLEDGELEDIAQRLADRKPLASKDQDPSPVAGVQSKIALTQLPDGRYALPISEQKVPTTHILKVPRRSEAADAIREDAACGLAGACGLVASHSRHVVIGDVDALLIERFDRVVDQNVVYRLHQEDFAQALGLPRLMKYERDGTEGRRFDAHGALSVLNRLAAPAKARETFVLAALFNLAIGNTDNHAKNHAVLYAPDGSAHLAPQYDLLPIRLHNGYTHQLAFHLGGATHFDDMTSQNMNAFLAEFGLEGTRARRFVEDAVKPMLETIEANSAPLRSIGQRTFDDLIGRELTHLCELLKVEVAIRERDYFEPSGGGWAIS